MSGLNYTVWAKFSWCVLWRFGVQVGADEANVERGDGVTADLATPFF